MRRLLLGLGALVWIGCPSPEPASPPPAQKSEAEAPKLPELFIDRRRLEVVLQQGPGWLLERVPIEADFQGDDFIGWRLRDLPIEFKDVDLRPGDIVIAINAMPVETPADFWAAWTTLTVASELRVAYLREGQERELSVPIFGSPSPTVAKELESQQGEPPSERPPAREPKRKDTVVIEPHEKPITDTVVDFSDMP